MSYELRDSAVTVYSYFDRRYLGLVIKNKTMHKSSVIIAMLLLFSSELLGQEGSFKRINKAVARIESYKKYDVIKVDEPADLKRINKNLITLTNYSRRRDDQGKVEETLNIPDGLCSRIYYFDKDRNLVFIREKIVKNEATTLQHYYFQNNTLIAVRDEKNADVMPAIDRSELRDRIKGYWRIVIK